MTFDSIGCYVDCSALSADDLNSEVVAFAAGYGYPADEALLARIGTDDEEEDDSQLLSEAADEAEEWLNDNTERPPFTYWSIEDNSLFLRVDVQGAQESDEVLGCADLPDTTTQTELTVDTARAIAAVLTPVARSWDASARFEVCGWRGLPCAVALIQGSTATAIFRYEEELADWAKTFTI